MKYKCPKCNGNYEIKIPITFTVEKSTSAKIGLEKKQSNEIIKCDFCDGKGYIENLPIIETRFAMITEIIYFNEDNSRCYSEQRHKSKSDLQPVCYPEHYLEEFNDKKK